MSGQSRDAVNTATPGELFLGEVRSRDIFPVLILHLVSQGPEYGNSIIRKMKEMSGGVMVVSPNTVYPLLRRLEEKGYLTAKWEDPDTRTRRFYTITPEGEEKYAEMKARFEEHLLRVRQAIDAIQRELFG
ncbi:putative transcriptional regulators [Rubrobacter radiotolerans]|uniref:PadR family transcriptional regulator n=1 Tax=Rubrobacter radiotolerans TaxID=42256 RepID=A0A023X4Z5_RUBRA|nr:PadR family transcriptional regulator [Rubrobacter radiotolerans]AHY47124.1 putative transcriptional regulators [Rubrobacter radiotolerans]MDX5894529.1 PadR family transcriptional regulator [Rubrobacter radiotolerans]SMC06199.1 DNA-binding transcriptional regulator, PadR family [Rubrobacter radiotolerans DSM 5868]